MTRIVELGTDECLELLYQEVVGRVGFQTPFGLRIVPVNYAVHGDSVVWRTAPFSELGTYGVGQEVVFEIDRIDHDTRTAWDVVLSGRVEAIEHPKEVVEVRRVEDPLPWAEGPRNLYLRLRWRDLRGRRIGEPREAPLTPPWEPWHSDTAV